MASDPAYPSGTQRPISGITSDLDAGPSLIDDVPSENPRRTESESPLIPHKERTRIKRPRARAYLEPRLVYRALRKISDWTLSNFFSEVLVVGQENIEEEGALIL